MSMKCPYCELVFSSKLGNCKKSECTSLRAAAEAVKAEAEEVERIERINAIKEEAAAVEAKKVANAGHAPHKKWARRPLQRGKFRK